MLKETETALLSMFAGVTVPVYLANPDPRVLHPGDTRLLPGVEPNDPRQTRILIQQVGDEYDPQRSCNAEIDYDLFETDSSAMSIPWPQPRILRFQIEFKGMLEQAIETLRSNFLQQFRGSDSTDISITWSVGALTITQDSAVTIDGMRSMDSTYNNQRRIRRIVIVTIETWQWTDEAPTATPLIQERILRRGFELGGDDIRNTTNLEEMNNG